MSYDKENGHPALRQIEDGTPVKHEFRQRPYRGERATAKIRGGHIVYNQKYSSPSGAAEEAVEDMKGKSTSINGWDWWEYKDPKTGRWRKIDHLRE